MFSFLEKLGISSKINLEDVYNQFLGFERKQQGLVVAGIVVLLFLFLSLPISCVSKKLSEKESEWHQSQKMARDIVAVQSEILGEQNGFDQLKKNKGQLGSDPIKQLIYNNSDQLGIDRQRINLKTINPVTNDLFVELGKDVNITNIRPDLALKLIAQLEHNDIAPLHIKKINMQVDSKNKQMIKKLDLSLTVKAPKE